MSRIYEKPMNKSIAITAMGLIKNVDMKAGREVDMIHYWSCEPFAGAHDDRIIYSYIESQIVEDKRSLNDYR